MRYKVKDPQGQTHIIEGPEGATPDQIIAQAKRLIPRQKSFGQRAAQVATFPMRAFRGFPIAASNLLQGESPSVALARGAMATRQGFKPQGIGENIASVAGESVPLAPLGGPLSRGGTIAQMIKMGMLGGGLSALTQTAEEGKPTPGRTAAASALSAMPPAIAGGVKSAFPYVAAKFTKTVPEAYRGLTTAFKEKFPGTPQALETASSKVFPTIKKVFDVINKRLEGRKKFMGMTMTPKEAMAEAEVTGGEPRTISRIVKEFKDVQKRSAPLTEKKVPSQLVGPTGKPLMRTVIERGIPKGEKLRRLSDMAVDINKQTEGSYTTDVLQTKRGIEREAFKMGGTSYKIFNKFKQQWGKLKDIESRMGINLNDPDMSGPHFEKIIRKQIEGKASPTDIGQIEAIKDLEQVTGKQIIEPLRNQIISSYSNTILSDYVPKGMLGKLLLMKYWPEGLASFFLGSPKAMGAVAQAFYNPSGPIQRAVRPAIAGISSRVLNQYRGGDTQQ